MGSVGDVLQVFKVYWALLLGNILEWYEFAIYSFLEPYLEAQFFHGSAISTWLGFACTFAARPFGGIALGLLGDLFGRKVSTFLSICGMVIGTVGQGLNSVNGCTHVLSEQFWNPVSSVLSLRVSA